MLYSRGIKVVKKIVTHYNPDLDAITSVWLIVRWLEGWENAEFKVVPAGQTYQGEQVDSHPTVVHVDTGLGLLDHHQTDEFTCAAKKTLEYIKVKCLKLKVKSFSSILKTGKYSKIRKDALRWNELAAQRLVEVVNQIDHFQEVYYPQPEADYWEFMAEAVLDGWKLLYREQDKLVIEKGLELLDGVYISLLSKVEAEEVLTREGIEFTSRWGKGIAIKTKNSQVISLAQKRGYKVVVSKHPVEQHVRIKAPPSNHLANTYQGTDLTSVYERLKQADQEASWFLHASKTMVLNGSAKNPQMKPTRLSLEEVVEMIKGIR